MRKKSTHDVVDYHVRTALGAKAIRQEDVEDFLNELALELRATILSYFDDHLSFKIPHFLRLTLMRDLNKCMQRTLIRFHATIN